MIGKGAAELYVYKGLVNVPEARGLCLWWDQEFNFGPQSSEDTNLSTKILTTPFAVAITGRSHMNYKFYRLYRGKYHNEPGKWVKDEYVMQQVLEVLVRDKKIIEDIYAIPTWGTPHNIKPHLLNDEALALKWQYYRETGLSHFQNPYDIDKAYKNWLIKQTENEANN